jgi:hypothetical protein
MRVWRKRDSRRTKRLPEQVIRGPAWFLQVLKSDLSGPTSGSARPPVAASSLRLRRGNGRRASPNVERRMSRSFRYPLTGVVAHSPFSATRL